MNKQVFTYTQGCDDLFENVLKDENLMMNHVVIEPGKIFPKHPTDALVYIIIVEGELTLQLETEPKEKFVKGQVLHIDKNVQSELGNTSNTKTELFVIKIDKDKN